MAGWERIGPPSSGREQDEEMVAEFDPDTDGPSDGKNGKLGHLPNEVWMNIIDCMFEDAAIKAHRGRPCHNEMRHYPLLRLRPGSDVLAMMTLTSKYMRHLVLRQRFGTLYFHGGGISCADEWEMFNLHMTIGKDKPEIQLAEPKIYVKSVTALLVDCSFLDHRTDRFSFSRILVRDSTNNKEYSEQLYKLIKSCPNLVTVEVSPIMTQQFFADHRLRTPIPRTVTTLRIIGAQSKGQILGLLGNKQQLFTDIGRMDRSSMPIPYYKKDDISHVQKLHIQPCFILFSRVPMVPAFTDGQEGLLGDFHTYEFRKEVSGDFGNLKPLKEITLDLRQVRLFPRSLEELMQYARRQYADSRVAEPELVEKMWKRNRTTNIWFWNMLGNTPKLPEMDNLVIDLDLCPFATDLEYDQWVSPVGIT